MYFIQGNPLALVVTKRRKRRHTQRRMEMPNAEQGLAWCQAKQAIFVYLPTAAHSLN